VEEGMDESEEPTEGGKHTNTDVTNAFHIKTERNWGDFAVSSK